MLNLAYLRLTGAGLSHCLLPPLPVLLLQAAFGVYLLHSNPLKQRRRQVEEKTCKQNDDRNSQQERKSCQVTAGKYWTYRLPMDREIGTLRLQQSALRIDGVPAEHPRGPIFWKTTQKHGNTRDSGSLPKCADAIGAIHSLRRRRHRSTRRQLGTVTTALDHLPRRAVVLFLRERGKENRWLKTKRSSTILWGKPDHWACSCGRSDPPPERSGM